MPSQDERQRESQPVNQGKELQLPAPFHKRADGITGQSKEKKPHYHYPAGGGVKGVAALFVEDTGVSEDEFSGEEHQVNHRGMDQDIEDEQVIHRGKCLESAAAENQPVDHQKAGQKGKESGEIDAGDRFLQSGAPGDEEGGPEQKRQPDRFGRAGRGIRYFPAGPRCLLKIHNHPL